MIQLTGSRLHLKDAEAVANGGRVAIAASVKGRLSRSRKFVEKAAAGEHPLYGINTGFGYLACQRIDPDKSRELQRNLVRSHAAGWGGPLSAKATRLAMALRLNALLKGAAGVRLKLCQALEALINKNILPIIPEYGSVGASGDLSPLAHLSLPLIGEGRVFFEGKEMNAAAALKKAKLAPLELQDKEGLALINGTQIMLAVGALALIEGVKLLDASDRVCSLSFEGLAGNCDALDPKIHTARGQLGQIASAKNLRSHLTGSYLHRKSLKRSRVQDPYSLRCAPQVHGACRDSLSHTQAVVERELNAATDNPLVFAESEKILSGGNFHGEPLAIVFDLASIALSEIANISERRLELLLNPNLSGLPAFLVPDSGLHSGYMAAQYLAGSIVNENKLLANPSSTDSIPGNVGIEDFVSMGMTSARKLAKVARNCRTVLAIEMLAAAQAVDLRKVPKMGKGTKELYQKLREKVPPLIEDRMLTPEIETATELLCS